jgi:hypothetical protein
MAWIVGPLFARADPPREMRTLQMALLTYHRDDLSRIPGWGVDLALEFRSETEMRTVTEALERFMHFTRGDSGLTLEQVVRRGRRALAKMARRVRYRPSSVETSARDRAVSGEDARCDASGDDVHLEKGTPVESWGAVGPMGCSSVVEVRLS